MLKRNRKGKKKMTLIIGAKCPEGIVLIADTNVTHGDGEHTHENKVMLPLQEHLPGTPVISVAAGFVDLFKEFNRKIPLRVSQRLREYQLNNIAFMKKTGLTEIEIQKQMKTYSKETRESEKGLKEEKPQGDFIPPYIYTGEDFLDDCKCVIEEICEKPIERYGESPLDVLIATKTEKPSLHHINALGESSEIETFISIGSGSEYANQFFKRKWVPEMNLLETATLATFVIKYVENLKIDSGVGLENNPPSIAVILNDGQYGFLTPLQLKNFKSVLESINKKTIEFEKMMSELDLISFSFE